MNLIGLSTGTTAKESNVDRMVQAILQQSGQSYEYVKLTDLTYSGCKGCVQLCAKPLVCTLPDDLQPIYPKLLQADAVVLGSPFYFGSINARAISFIERFFGYRHVDIAIEDKPFVLAGVASMGADRVEASFRQWLRPFRVQVLDCVVYRSEMPPCLHCGRHRECDIGGLHHMRGEAVHDLRITPDMKHAWEDDPDTVAAVQGAAAKLRGLTPAKE